MKRRMKRLLALLMAMTMLATGTAIAERISDRTDGEALAAAGGELLEQIRTLIRDETFLSTSGASGEIAGQIETWAEEMQGQPLYTRVYPYPELDKTLAYMNDGMETPELSDAASAYFEPMTAQLLCAQANAQQGAAYLAAANLLRVSGFYALPEGFENCVVVYDFGTAAFAVGMRRESVAGQEFVSAQGCVCTPEIRDLLAEIAAFGEETGAKE